MLSYLNPFPSLPQYRGPYKVGTTEYEIPVSEIESSSTVPDPEITTVKFRIYYPTTSDAKGTIAWLPLPQREWNRAYASFVGLSSRTSNVISSLPSFLSYVKIPACPDTPMASRTNDSTWPLALFSHGLGGNYNTYSSILGSMASCGIVCVAPEHRDGSAPTSLIKSSPEKIARTVPYQKHGHNPSTEVLNARNAQLRVRLWELELIYTALDGLNHGRHYTNLAESSEKSPNLVGTMDMSPGRVTWAGHSFGGATVVQFVKSVYYHQRVPQTKIESRAGAWDWTPLYTPSANHGLIKQVTSASPVALLDVWTMPLRGDVTQWLWERPMPCYDRVPSGSPTGQTPNVVSVMSTEFYRYTDLMHRTRALLSKSPVDALRQISRTTETSNQNTVTPELNVTPPSPIQEISKEPAWPQTGSATSSREQSPSPSQSLLDDDAPSMASSRTSVSDIEGDFKPSGVAGASDEPHLYLVPQSAHLSQSDFGCLFPNLVRYFSKAIEPEKTIALNVRAILAMMRGAGIDVKSYTPGEDVDKILHKDGLGPDERWQRIPLVD